MHTPSARERFRYWFDGVMSKGDVFGVLLSSEVSEVYLRPASADVRPGAEADLDTVLEAARRKGETAIGHRLAERAGDSASRCGVRVNPPKQEVLRFADGDRVIVLADS